MQLRHALLLAGCIWAMPVFAPAADEDPIPSPLKPLLIKITQGMTRDQVKNILLPSYPKLREGGEFWSGQSGWFGFSLNQRYSIMFSAVVAEREQLLTPKRAQGMTRDEENNILFQSYPRFTLGPEMWSGQVGCFGFHLNSRDLVMLSDVAEKFEEVTSAGPDVSIFDNVQAIRYDLHPTTAGHYEIKSF